MSLSRIKSLRVAAVLEECSDRLDLLAQTRRVRKGQTNDMICRDCESISQQMTKFRMELEEKQSFTSLIQVVEEEEERRQTVEMKRQLEKEMEQRTEALLQRKEEMEHKLEKLRELEAIEKQLMKPLEPKQEEKQDLISLHHINLKRSEETERQLHEKIKAEKRIHQGTMKFLHNKHEVLLQMLEKAKEVTTKSLQEKEKELEEACRKRAFKEKSLMEMKRKLREMEQVVTEEKKEQERLAQIDLEHKSATKIQACLRGFLIRKTYKKTEKDTKQKKKGGKKKK